VILAACTRLIGEQLAIGQGQGKKAALPLGRPDGALRNSW
jgi:hypothetical protein